VLVRARVDADLDACARLAQVVHASDGYPADLPGDVRRFVASHAAYAAWVAEVGGELVGHVALHNRASPEVMALAHQATRTTDGAVAVVARLLVSPTARRRGVGRALITTRGQRCDSTGPAPHP
jgi:GNAT superfamily N-acetyltransferase